MKAAGLSVGKSDVGVAAASLAADSAAVARFKTTEAKVNADDVVLTRFSSP